MLGKTSAGTSAKEQKTVTAGTSQTVVTPSKGKLLSQVTINPTPSQAKTATPSATQQTIEPDSGKLLSQVLVNAVPDSEKKGLYVWKKLSAQGGTFIDYVVSDNTNAYPDGGTKDGYWYEKVVEGIGLESFGYTKYAIDKFTRTESYPYLNSCPINHSLGEIPRFVYVIANASVTTHVRTTKLLGTIPTWMQPSDMTYNSAPYVMEYFRVSDSKLAMTYAVSGLIVTSEKVTFDNSNYSFATGVEYTIITMA